MPSRFAPPTVERQRSERQLAQQFLARQQATKVSAPWEGFVPDVPQHSVGFNAASDILGLVVRSDPQGSGEILTTDAGWSPVDEARLGASLPSLSGSSTLKVARLKNFYLVSGITGEPSSNLAPQTILLIAGDGATIGSFQMYRLDPVTAQWTVIALDTTGMASATAPLASIDGNAASDTTFRSMPDSCVFQPGAPARTDGAGAIEQPCFIWTNNLDPVMVYPSTTDNLEFQPLTEQFSSAADTGDFRAVSVATFNDRVYFLNTVENLAGIMVRHKNRLRRTARFTADPLPANLGSGQITLEQFSGNGVAIRPLGNVLAAYFEDGVAFVRDTGDQVTPNAVQTLDVTRGLLSTHAVCNISNNQHFGIFDDGWWILDSNGRWQEVGIAGGEGKPVNKWKDSFYAILNMEDKHRIQVAYDPTHNWVRIVVPVGVVSADTTAVWIYDINSDRVFLDNYVDGVTVWGDVLIYSSAALIWSAASMTWNDIVGSWASYDPLGGFARPAHGNHLGFVHFHDDDLNSRDGLAIPWLYQSVVSDMGEPRLIKSTERLMIEYVNSGNAGTVNVQFIDGRGNTTSENVVLNDGSTDHTRLKKCWRTLTSEHLGFRVSGEGPIRIRQFEVGWHASEGEGLA